LRSDSIISRRTLIASLAAILAPLAAEAQQAGRVWRIGHLSATSGMVDSEAMAAFRQGLREQGLIEGQHVAIDYRAAEGRLERLPMLAAALVALNADVIVAGVAQAATAARQATGVIPIVMVVVGDPVGLGLVANLARPGGNVTGLSNVSVALIGKQVQFLTEAVPSLSRLAALWHAGHIGRSERVREVENAARAVGVRLDVFDVQGPDGLEAAFAAMVRQRAEGLVVINDAMFFLNAARIAEFAARSRIPAIYGARLHAEAGGLMAYAPSFLDLNRRAAGYVAKIVKGAKPADLPVEEPTKFELVINLKTAKALGLTIPQSLLLRADQVIQ